MVQNIGIGYQALLAQAREVVRTIPAREAVNIFGQDDVVFVDLRDPRELEREGQIPGAFHSIVLAFLCFVATCMFSTDTND